MSAIIKRTAAYEHDSIWNVNKRRRKCISFLFFRCLLYFELLFIPFITFYSSCTNNFVGKLLANVEAFDGIISLHHNINRWCSSNRLFSLNLLHFCLLYCDPLLFLLHSVTFSHHSFFPIHAMTFRGRWKTLLAS